MSVSATHGEPCALRDPRFAAAGQGGVLAMLPALLIGLAAPFVLLVWLRPAVLLESRLVIMLVLVSIFVIAGLMLLVGVVAPKVLVEASFDRERRVVRLLRQSAFASAASELPLDQVAAISQSAQYDDDGYPTLVAELRLRSGETVALPAGLTAEQVAAVRRELGLR